MDEFLAMAKELEKGKNPNDSKGLSNTPDDKKKEGLTFISEGVQFVGFSRKEKIKK